MRIARLAFILLVVTAISCEPSTKPQGALQPAPTEPEAKTETETMKVTINGREATPEEKEAFGEMFKKSFADAFAKAVNEEMHKKLEITDPMEVQLFSGAFGPERLSDNELYSVYLIQPGTEIKEPRTIVLLTKEKPILRFTRATGPVERPVAIRSVTGTKDGRLLQADVYLVYGPDGKWKQYRP